MKRIILIVEDDEDILELIQTIFIGLHDYRILCARDGEEALKIINKDKPDVILLDLQIPKLDGYKVCKSIKTDTSLSRIKVIMLSGMAQNSDLQKAQEAGADGYIVKPFMPVEVLEKVEEILTSN